MENTSTEASLSAEELRSMLVRGGEWLRRNASAINAINVFPVPDGDTGSNMSATFDAAVACVLGAAAQDGGDAGGVLRAAAHGALLGARGNSGVILSQILEGVAAGAGATRSFDCDALVAGLRHADVVAALAVSQPKAGTILTVLSDAARAAAARAASTRSLSEVLAATVAEANASVARTPDLLPVLKEAGVVDSGGLGLAVLLAGFLSYLRGDALTDEAEPPALQGITLASQLSGVPHPSTTTSLGYCTEFMIEGDSLPRETLRQGLQSLGDSVLVVGQDRLLRVHVHTLDPGAALSLGTRYGALSRVKVDNIDAQHRALVEADPASASTSGSVSASVVAVAVGDGFAELLRGYGATIVRGGQTANPSTKEILDAIERAPGREVYVLPNNPNVLAGANQAGRLSHKPVYVVPTRSLPQGVDALLAFNQDRTAAENITAMEEAATSVRTIEVTRAARSVALDGVTAVAGQPIALIDDRMIATAESPEAAGLAALEGTPMAAEIITIYYGREVSAGRAESLAEQIRARRQGTAVETLSGGQPYYDYVISVE